MFLQDAETPAEAGGDSAATDEHGNVDTDAVQDVASDEADKVNEQREEGSEGGDTGPKE